MTTIEYKPHCANCGALIDEEVTYSEIISEHRTGLRLLTPDGIEINPYRCNHCGEFFDGITIRQPRNVGPEILVARYIE